MLTLPLTAFGEGKVVPDPTRPDFSETTKSQTSSSVASGVDVFYSTMPDGSRVGPSVINTDLLAYGNYGETPGNPSCPPGTWNTYRRMMKDPTIALAFAIVAGPIVGADFTFQMMRPDGTPPKRSPVTGNGVIKDPIDKELEDRMAFIKSVYSPMEIHIKEQMMRGLIFGHRAFEQVYQPTIFNGNQFIGLKKLKPLRPDITSILIDPSTGDYAGVKNAGVELDAVYTLLYSYNNEDDNWYGQSRLENLRELAWWPWICLMKNSERLDRKVSNIIPVVKGPMEQVDTINGKQVSGYQVGQAILQALTSGNGVLMQNLVAGVDELQQAPELAKASKWDISPFDVGNVSTAQAGQNNKARYYDSLKFRGMLRPERAALESAIAGSRADSMEHGDAGLAEGQLIAQDFLKVVNYHSVDRLLAWNFGEDARGCVFIAAAPIVDDRRDLYTKLVNALMVNPDIVKLLLTKLDLTSIFEGSGVALKPGGIDISAEDIQDQTEQQQQQIIKKGIANADPKNVNPSGAQA